MYSGMFIVELFKVANDWNHWKSSKGMDSVHFIPMVEKFAPVREVNYFSYL